MEINHSDIVKATVMIKNGGYEKIAIPSDLLSQLAVTIGNKGSEYIQLVNGKNLEVVGFFMNSSQAGERIIFIGENVQ